MWQSKEALVLAGIRYCQSFRPEWRNWWPSDELYEWAMGL